jgi:hypothetical protein
MSDKSILAIHVKATLQSTSEFVLLAIFIDITSSQILLNFNVVISGNDENNIPVKVNCNQFVGYIFSAKNQYAIDQTRSELVKDQLAIDLRDKTLESLLGKIASGDTGAVSYHFKRFFDHVFQVDDTEIDSAYMRISHGVLEIINAIERKQTHTVAQNSEIAKKYVGDSVENMRRITESNILDTIVCVYTIARGGNIIVAGSILYNTIVESQIARTTIFNQKLDSNTFSTSNFIVDLFHQIENFAVSDGNVRDVSQRIDSSLDTLHSERLGLVLKSGSTEKISNALSRALPSEYAKSEISVLCERYNSIIVDTVFSPNINLKVKEHEDDEQDELANKKARVVDVDLALAPARGVKVSQLKPGMRIYVIINASTGIGKQIVNQLNLMENNRVKPVSGLVESVKRDNKDNYIVVTKIANNLYGKSIEEEDIKVKSGDPVVDKKTEKTSRSMLVGLIIGAFLILIIIVSLFVLL